jgi:hypothetical protein
MVLVAAKLLTDVDDSRRIVPSGERQVVWQDNQFDSSLSNLYPQSASAIATFNNEDK